MKRRTVLAALSAAAFMRTADAQQRGIVKIGVITLGIGAGSPYLDALRLGLRQHGYVEGRNISFEYRFANGNVDRLAAMAAELVGLNVAAIITESSPAALAVSKATKTIPIVMAVGPNPVDLGLAASLARPGGNVTGLTLTGADRTAKQLQLVKESLPSASRVAVLYSPRSNVEVDLEEARDAARVARLALQFFEVRAPQEFEGVFEALAGARPDAMITIGHGLLLGNSRRIAQFALKIKLPAVFPEREFAESGGLMAYGPDLGANFRRAAAYVDRILNGAKPGELPIEQPTKWELVVNLRTAQALGIKIPGAVLVRADEIIQ